MFVQLSFHIHPLICILFQEVILMKTPILILSECHPNSSAFDYKTIYQIVTTWFTKELHK